ncbi:hypothetical protein CF326_g8222 [Tilletia indica]|nr:hypothetical protein CF326_g8222 [Tilletia indica]
MTSVALQLLQDQSRKQLQRAALWFDVLEGRLRARAFARPTADDPSPPLQETLARTSASPIDSTQASSHPTQPIHDDVLAHATVDPDLSLTITDLARRCPACFGGIASGSSVPQSPNVIVCLDGNFAHKRRKRNDAVTRSPSAPTFFLSTRQVASAQKRFLSSAKSDGPRTGCSSEVKAAVEGAVKASKGAFDVVGVIGLTCRHGCPLLLCDVRETGEAHFYAYALLDHLVRACSGRIDSLGICYDIGCKLAVSPRLKASFQEHKIKLSFAVSLFHVFGHDLDCQLKYSPRRTPGYGLTDGESLERLWSAMADLVSSTRGMSLVGRHHTLSSHLSFIANEHLARIASFLKTRQIRVLVERKRIVQQIERASAAVTARATTTGVNLSHSNTAPTSFPDSLRHLASTFESLSQQRQVNAFNRPTAYRRRRAANSASESTVQVSASQLQGSLHLSAQSLYLALSQWHALDSFVKRRDSAASQKTQERLNSAKTAALTKAKRLRLAVNDVIEATNNITGPTASQLSLIAEARLLSTETLAQVSRLGAFHVHSSEPWFLDSDLMGGLDGYELLVRCDEEAARLETELTNLWTWIGTTQSGIEANRNVMACSGWSELVDRELKKLKTLKTWWGRPPPKNHAFIDALAEGGGLDPDLDDDEQDLDDPEPPSPHTTLSRSPQLSDLADSPLCDAGTGNKGGEVNEDGDFELDDDDFEKLYGALSVDKLAISPASDQDDSSTEDE